jgi:hypothetical protein
LLLASSLALPPKAQLPLLLPQVPLVWLKSKTEKQHPTS